MTPLSEQHLLQNLKKLWTYFYATKYAKSHSIVYCENDLPFINASAKWLKIWFWIKIEILCVSCKILLKRINRLQTAWLQNHFYCVYIVIHVWAACFVQKLKSENTPQSTTIYSTDRNSGLIFMHRKNMVNCIASVYDWWYLIAKKAYLLWWLQMHNDLAMWFGIKIEMLF